jgi:hypothetical protein
MRTIAALSAPVCLVAIALAGCNSGGKPVTPSPSASPGGSRATTLYASSLAVPGHLVSLPASANGTVAPSTSITTQVTNSGQAYFVAYDGSGKLWFTSCLDLPGTHGPVIAVDATASGTNVTPLITLSGANTGLEDCQSGIAVDPSGDVYVADDANASSTPGGHIAIFGLGQTGNVAPARTIAGANAGFHSVYGVALDADDNLYVTDSCMGYSCTGDVAVFPAGANGNVGPTRRISGGLTQLDAPLGIAVDKQKNIYVANGGNNTITVYAAGSNGNVTPTRTIGGSLTTLADINGIAVDNAGYLYVGNVDQAGSSDNYPVLVFAPGANGNVAPVQSITINTPRFSQPAGVAVK